MGESAMSAYSSVARSPLSMRRLMMSVGRGSCPCARHGSQLRPPSWQLLKFQQRLTMLLHLLSLFAYMVRCSAHRFISAVKNSSYTIKEQACEHDDAGVAPGWTSSGRRGS